MTPSDFILILRKMCQEDIKGEFDQRDWQNGKDQAFREVITTIDVYLKTYNEGEAQ